MSKQSRTQNNSVSKQSSQPASKAVLEEIKPQPNIRITVIGGQLKWDVEDETVDGNTKMDPYVKIKYVNKDFEELFELQTKVDIDGSTKPKWDQPFELYILDLTKDLIFEIWEWDQKSSDDFIASGKMSMQAALKYNGAPFELEVLIKNKPFGSLHLRVEQIRKSKPEEEEINQIIKDQRVTKFTNYMHETGLERAFQLIFAEILTKKIDRNDVYTYTAIRLRQIGSDLKPFFNNKHLNNSILNNISEVQEQKNQDNEFQD